MNIKEFFDLLSETLYDRGELTTTDIAQMAVNPRIKLNNNELLTAAKIFLAQEADFLQIVEDIKKWNLEH